MIFIILFGIESYDYLTNYFNLNEKYSNLKRSSLLSSHFEKYIKSIHSDMYIAKLPNFINFREDYLASITELPNIYKNMILDYTTKADKITSQFKIFKRYPWKIYVSHNNLEMNMPFTINNVIIIPISKFHQLSVLYRKGHYDNQFINILIHEKIHVIQRDNQPVFDTFYKNYYNRFLGEKYQQPLPNELAKIYMTNPDSNNSIWTFLFDNKEYIPLLVFKNNKIQTLGYDKTNLSNIIDLNYVKKELGYGEDISFYHPNEIFACDLAHQIMDESVSKGYSNLLNNL